MKLIYSALLALVFLATASSAFAGNRPTFKPGKTTPRASPNSGPPNGFAAPQRKRAPEPYAELITEVGAYEEFSTHSEGIVKSDLVKFLIDARSSTPKIYFLNGNFEAPNVPEFVKYHFNFAEHFLQFQLGSDAFNELTYFARDQASKKFIAGSLQRYHQGSPGAFYGIQFYPQDKIAEQSVLFAVKMVKKVFLVPDAKLAFVGYGIQQTVSTITQELAKLGVEARRLDEIFAQVPYVAMNKGEAWGYLRVGQKADALSPEDIPLFTELPLDLSVVSATITTVIQDAGSHVNLKSKERGTPNMVLRDEARVKELVSAWRDRPIHLKVEGSDFSVRASTPQEVTLHARKREDRPWQNFPMGRSRTLKTFDEMAQVATAAVTIPDSKEFGGKAAKLGFLAHREILGEGSAIQRKLQYRLTPLGFGIPMAYYFDFVNSNPALKAKIQEMINAEMSLNGASPMAPERKKAALEEIRGLFYRTKVPDALVAELTKKLVQFQADFRRVYPKSELKKMKFRSSSNSEDVEDFDGAGLHDSFSASLKNGIGDPGADCRVVEGKDGVETKQEMEPETPLCALKGVYASLWNKRAVDERSYARINHATAGMGIAVNQKYGSREKSEGIKEIANGVVVTRILAGEGIYGYQLSLNTEDNLVTNPTPGTQSEIVLATFLGNEKPEFTITQFAKISVESPVRSDSIVNRATFERIVELARAVERGYCRAVPAYYQGSCEYVTSDSEKPKSLDMEFKIFSNGEVLMKQSREFGGR